MQHSPKESIASLLGKETMSHLAIKHGMYLNSNQKLGKEIFPWISVAALYKKSANISSQTEHRACRQLKD